jgi:predicted RNA-binding Zn ribbon-like protein
MMSVVVRQRAEALGLPPPHETSQVPRGSQPRASRDQWQQTLIQYARQINWAQRLTHELEPLSLLQLRFDVAQRALELAPPRTFEQWDKAAELLYYAIQCTAQGEQEALVEANTILNQAQLPWKQAIMSALAKYLVLSKRANKESEHIWQALACSLQGGQAEPEARESSMPFEAQEEDHQG